MFTGQIERHEVITQGYTWRLFWRRLYGLSANILVTFQATLNLPAYFINHCLAVLCKFLGDFWAFWERVIFSQRIEESMKCWRFDGFGKLKFEDVYETVSYQPGALIWSGQLSGVFPTHFTLQLPFNNTLNFTPTHVYPRLIKYLLINHKNCNFRELKNSQVTKERENLH